MSPDIQRLQRLLAEAVAKTSPAEREGYLRQVCGEDAQLRVELERLLNAYERVGDFLEQSVIPPVEALIGEGPGAVIGRYKLLEEIGEGAFGRVFMAEQTEPVQRKVALKIVKAGMDTREVIARFEAERQALALMEHPNIARVLDAGATETGRPYFVMELVRGIPITTYCDQQQLSTRERLELFMKICAAVQHAHQKGIVHRDLKPTNVLVTLIDGEAVPKVIDFGVAKALGQKLTEKTLFTAFQQMVGTPAYMSPEQAALSGVDVDSRSDIYSLGVLLYELLTGVTPFDPETLHKAALDEVRRMIRETEPSKPSIRLTELTKSQKSEVRSQKWKEVQGDLDWIVMKALEKDRARRYETANALAEDLQHHLHHEPVLAGPPGVVYRLGKFARRRRGELIAAGSVAVVLCVAAVLSYWQAVKTREAEGRAASSRAELKTALSQPSVASRSADPRARGLFSGLANVERAAALSPDEAMLAYVDWAGPDGDVMIRELKSGARRNLTESEKHLPGLYEMCPDAMVWSPDSQWLAYHWLGPTNTDLRLVSVKTGEIRVLVPPDPKVEYFPIDWAPDATWILCYRNKGGLARVSVPEGQARELVPFEKPWPDHARISPDGKYVVFSRPTGEGDPAKRPHALFVTEVATGTTRPLGAPGNCRTPIWSPSQPVMLFTSDRLSNWDLWGMRVQEGRAASEPFPVQYGFGCYELKLTRAGKLLVHRDVKPGDGYTIAVPPSAAEALKVASLPGRIYFSMNGRLHTMAVKDTKPALTPLGYPAPPSRALHGGHRWFLEIRTMKSTQTNNPPRELFAVRDDAEANQAIQLTNLPEIGQMTGVNVFAMTLIHPGQERDRIIGWARDASRGLDDGLISWAATKPMAPSARSGPPSPPAIYLVRVAFDAAGDITGLAEPLSAIPLVTNATTHDWSPDGRRLAYTKPGRTNALHILDLETRQSSALTEGEAPSWSPDGEWIAFHRGNASLHLIRPDGSDLRTLGRLDSPAGMKFLGPPRPGFYRVVWAPNSKALVYDFWDYGGLNTTYHQLFHRPLDGGEPQSLTADLMTDTSPVAWLEGEK
jgi:Tol biopolymer transport system component